MVQRTEVLGAEFLEVSDDLLETYKLLAERAIAQVPDDRLHWRPTPGSSSIAVLVKHVAGSLRSRWTDFLATDGEKPDRDPDGEFVEGTETRAELMELWERGWMRLFDTLATLEEEDLLRTVTVRGAQHVALEAIYRQTLHYAFHIGQIVALAREIAEDEGGIFDIPPGGP